MTQAPAEAAARGAVAVAAAPAEHVTPYDRFAWSERAIERALASGRHAAELAAYFGAQEYRQLAALARRAAQVRASAHAPRVILVPGIMGSQLGLRRAAPLPPDVLWIDPIDIERGRLNVLRLRAHGLTVECHDYDWRRPVAQLGRELAARLRATDASRLALVAHSMGGLLARVALAQPAIPHVERVVLLGTPNCGSFAAVQALRGTYAVVRKIARLVRNASAESLTTQVFSSFPSLYDLLPGGGTRLDLFDPQHWPPAGPRPRAELLEAARATRAQLAPADERFTVIAGTGQETVTAVARGRDQFIYTLTRHGDGTVPTVSATLAGAAALYARVAHSDLTRDPQVATAVLELLSRGRTTRLPPRLRSASRACVRIGDRELQRTHVEKVDWAALTPEARRLFLQNLNEPPHLKLRVPRTRRRRR